METIFEIFKVDTVYHAAAYNLLDEENVCEGVKNNVFSALAVAKAALEKKVSNYRLNFKRQSCKTNKYYGSYKKTC